MLLSRNEIIGFAVSILIIAAMGVIVFTGPYHKVNKVAAAPAHTYPVIHAQIVTDPTTIGRYVPATITAHVGQTISFVNNSNAVHTVTSDAQSNGASVFNSKDIPIGATWQFAPTRTGTFPYYCIYHPYMHGKIVVKP